MTHLSSCFHSNHLIVDSQFSCRFTLSYSSLFYICNQIITLLLAGPNYYHLCFISHCCFNCTTYLYNKENFNYKTYKIMEGIYSYCKS